MCRCWCGEMFKKCLLAGAVLIATWSTNSIVFAETGRIQVAGVKTLFVTPSSVRSYPKVAEGPNPANIGVGDMLPLQYMMVVNLERFHLPRPRDGWVYFEVGQNIMRVDLNSREVLEQMGTLAN